MSIHVTVDKKIEQIVTKNGMLKQSLTPKEQENIYLAHQYMSIVYSPQLCKGAESVKHLCTEDSEFIAPTTFPDCKDLLQYAEHRKKIMECLDDFHITSYDIVVAQDDWVCIRYSAEGTHKGAPYKGIEPTGKHAKWTASAMFEIDRHIPKLKRFYKDWDKAAMWKQLGWPVEEYTSV